MFYFVLFFERKKKIANLVSKFREKKNMMQVETRCSTDV